MRGINEVRLAGHLGATPELRVTRTGKSVCELSLATNRTVKTDGGFKDVTTWHRVTLWERQAELATNSLTKGSGVYIEGSLRTDSWEDKNTGQRRYKTYVVAHTLLPVLSFPRTHRAAAHDTQDTAGRPMVSGQVPHSPVNEDAIPF